MGSIPYSRVIKREKVHRILIRATNWVGDAVMTLPALEAVRKNFPLSDITVMAKPWVAPIFEGHPAVNGLVLYKKEEGMFRRGKSVIRTVGMIRRRRFDLAILFQNAFEAALLVFLGGVPFRLGYDRDGRGLLLTHGVTPGGAVLGVHQVGYYLGLLRSMGWEAESRDPVLYIPETWKPKALHILRSKGIASDAFVLGLAPGAVFGKAKRWGPERFAEIGDRAVENWGASVLIFGSDKERKICQAVMNGMSHTAVDLCGETALSDAIVLIDQCGFFLSNDSGLMHVAAALGIPTVGIFGSTDPVATGPRGTKSVVVRHELSCAPCLKPECDRNYECMQGITVTKVWEQMERLRGAVQ
ncbi:MAG: lipopolysaccharide heptosyltransferase II [Desulfatiglandaceae bacterium]